MTRLARTRGTCYKNSMTDVHYEYVDESGGTHRVRSASDVPKRYRRSMLAVGEETSAPSHSFSSLSSWLPARNTSIPIGVPSAALLVFLGAFLFRRRRSYLVQVLAAAVLGTWGLLRLSDLVMHSKYAQPYQPPRTSAPDRAVP